LFPKAIQRKLENKLTWACWTRTPTTYEHMRLRAG